MAGSRAALDATLRALVRRTFRFDAAPPELLALGAPALARLLDAPDSVFFDDEMDWRDYGGNRRQALAAFAEADLARVLAAIKRRKWPDARVVLSGVGLVRDARLVPVLARAYAGGDPLTRAAAVEQLGGQRHPLATATVERALRDRSSDVRRAATRALAQLKQPKNRARNSSED
ncbi:MAG TPA: HEAT repeat domain-containing protein [Polyangia bacterium]|nr:HEAT repeat domain-containing protein [Polyangia bacterium]